MGGPWRDRRFDLSFADRVSESPWRLFVRGDEPSPAGRNGVDRMAGERGRKEEDERPAPHGCRRVDWTMLA
jgi:hypothetical protein